MSEDSPENERQRKLKKLQELGIEPYNGPYPVTHHAPLIQASFADLEGQSVAVAGRLVAIRVHGKATFAHLDDGEGRIQLYMRADTLAGAYTTFTDLLDIGDIIGCQGTVFKTRTGEVTLSVQQFTLLTKSLRELPEKWHGLKDVELRYRQRYLDFIANSKARQNIHLRIRMIALVRRFLQERDFMEVDTPILQPIYGGAMARPFVTHHHALNLPLYLRIAPELYLKRMTVGGFNRVYEIGRNFRNEGISSTHNPEFTELEVYQAYADYRDMMQLTEELIAFLAQQIFGSYRIPMAGAEINLEPPWERLSLQQAFRKHAGIEIESLQDLTFAQDYLGQNGIRVEKKLSWGTAVDEILKKRIEPELIGPVFLYDYPTVMSPLAKNKPGDPDWVERFQPILVGIELGNAFSELADPQEQRSRFQKQHQEKEKGDEEAHPMDEDFVTALEYGLPPTGGLGIGLDRLIMLFAQEESLREIITFPTLRPKTL
jgi:lysyl-tRNA synthetase class 2